MLKSMKLTPKEGAEESFEAKEMERPAYPMGLSIRLDEEALKKLKLNFEDFEMEEEVEIMGIAKVTAISNYETQEHKDYGCTLQITDLEVTLEGKDSKAAKKMYAKEEPKKEKE